MRHVNTTCHRPYFFFSPAYCISWWPVAEWEVPFPQEEIQTVVVWARGQTSRHGCGRTDTWESDQNAGHGAVGGDGRLDSSSSPGPTSGGNDLECTARKWCRGESKLFCSILLFKCSSLLCIMFCSIFFSVLFYSILFYSICPFLVYYILFCIILLSSSLFYFITSILNSTVVTTTPLGTKVQLAESVCGWCISI